MGLDYSNVPWDGLIHADIPMERVMMVRYTLAIDVLQHHIDYLVKRRWKGRLQEYEGTAEILAEDIANLNHAIDLLVATDLGEHWLFGKGEEE